MSTPNPGTSVPQIPTLGRQEADGQVVPFSSLKPGDKFVPSRNGDWYFVPVRKVYTKTQKFTLPENGLPVNAICKKERFWFDKDAPVIVKLRVQEALPLWLLEGGV